MEDISNYIGFIVCLVSALFLILKPKPIMKWVGTIYWNMGKFTALGKSEDTKKYFLGENTFWFRTLGIIWFVIIAYYLIATIQQGN